MRLAFALASLALLTAAGEKKPLPDEAAIAKAKALVADTFNNELAGEPAGAIKALLAAADEAADRPDDDAGCAALLLVARETAERAGELRQAFEAIDRLAARFDYDASAAKLGVVQSAAKAARTAEARIVVVNRALELIDDALAAGRFDTADAAGKAAQGAASKLRDADLRKEVSERRKDIERRRKRHEADEKALAAARQALEADPNDPAANLALGRHLCFDRNDWPAGLKHLAKAEGADLQKAALADLAGASEAVQQETLAGWWWDLAESAGAAGDERDERGYRSRSVFWYSKAVGDLSGLARARAAKRLKEASGALAAAAAQQGNDGGKYIDVVLAPGVAMRLVKIPASPDGQIKSFYLGQTEVTQKQWKAVMGSNPSEHQGDDELPVTNILRADCHDFIIGANRISSRLWLRMPTADEWMFGCFCGSAPGEAYPGDPSTFAWHKGSPAPTARRVGQKKPNRFGLLDILGNCWELTAQRDALFGFGVDVVIAADKLSSVVASFDDRATSANVGFRVAADPR